MRYFVLLAGFGELAPWDELSAEDQEAQMAQLAAFDEACKARPGVEMASQAPLGDGSMATTLRTRGGEMTIYTPGEGADLLRADRAGDAVRLASVLHELVPDAVQVRAMLALVLLQHARRDARVHEGRLVTLADQDRSLWHHDEIRTGLRLVASLEPAEGYPEELRLQALIAAEHARAPSARAHRLGRDRRAPLRPGGPDRVGGRATQPRRGTR